MNARPSDKPYPGVESHDLARRALEALLEIVAKQRTTGDCYVRIEAHCGGVRNVFIAVEGRVS